MVQKKRKKSQLVYVSASDMKSYRVVPWRKASTTIHNSSKINSRRDSSFAAEETHKGCKEEEHRAKEKESMLKKKTTTTKICKKKERRIMQLECKIHGIQTKKGYPMATHCCHPLPPDMLPLPSP